MVNGDNSKQFEFRFIPFDSDNKTIIHLRFSLTAPLIVPVILLSALILPLVVSEFCE